MRNRVKIICVLMMVFAFSVTPAAGQADTPYIAWRPDGTMLAVGYGTTLNIVDAETMTVLNSFTDLEIQRTEAAWSPDGSRLAIANGPDVEVWETPWDPNMAHLQFNYAYYATYNPPVQQGFVFAIAWSPDGTLVASAVGEIIDIWYSETGISLTVLHHDGGLMDVEWNSVSTLASAGGSLVAYWEITNQEPEKIFRVALLDALPAEDRPWVGAISWSPDGNWLAEGAADGRIRLWDTTTQEFRTFSTEYDPLVFQAHSAAILSTSWSPTGQYIASGSQDHSISIIEAQTGQQVQVIQAGAFDFVNSVAWSPDGSKLAYGSADGSVTLFDATQLPGYAPMATAEAE
jgi:WD40 repeat protein